MVIIRIHFTIAYRDIPLVAGILIPCLLSCVKNKQHLHTRYLASYT